MNNNISSLLVLVLGVLFATFTGIQILTDPDSIGKLSLYLSVGVFVLSFVNASAGFMCSFSLMVIMNPLKWVSFYNVGYTDLVSLNIPPIIGVAGLAAGSLIRCLFQGRFRGRVAATWLGVIVACSLLGGAALVRSGNLSAGYAGEVLNKVVYLMFIPVVVSEFLSPERWNNLLKGLIFFVVIIALYGLWQVVFGIPNLIYEYEIVFKGTSERFEMAKKGYGERIMSTTNSNGSLGMTVALCSCLVFWLRSSIGGRLKVFDWIIILLFVAVAVCSLRRTSLLIILIFPIAFFMLSSWRKVISFYGASFLVLAMIFTFSGQLVDWSYKAGKQAHAEREGMLLKLTSPATFTTRFRGFDNLKTNPELWTLFGMGDEAGWGAGMKGAVNADVAARNAVAAQKGEFYKLSKNSSHDALTSFIMKYGFVPSFALAAIGVVCARWIHRKHFSIEDRKASREVRVAFALTAAMLATLLSSPQALSVFPVNLMVGIVLAGLVRSLMNGSDSLSLSGMKVPDVVKSQELGEILKL